VEPELTTIGHVALALALEAGATKRRILEALDLRNWHREAFALHVLGASDAVIGWLVAFKRGERRLYP